MSARIVVTLILEYDGNDVGEYDGAMECARQGVVVAGDDAAMEYESVRVLEVQVSG